MGVIELFVTILIVVGLGWLCVYALSQLTPGHPGIIDNIIWFVVVLIIIVVLARALGLTGYDPPVPRVR